MYWLKEKVFETDVFGQVGESLSGGKVLLKNVPGALAVLEADYINGRCQRPLLMVAETLEDAEEYADDLTTLLDANPSPPYPPVNGGESKANGGESERHGPCLLPGVPAIRREMISRTFTL